MGEMESEPDCQHARFPDLCESRDFIDRVLRLRYTNQRKHVLSTAAIPFPVSGITYATCAAVLNIFTRPVFLTYESIVHNSRYSRSPSPSSDSDEGSYMSDSESVDSSAEHQHMVGDMDIDLPSPTVGNAKTDSSQEPNRPSHDGTSDGDEEEEDEETRRENRRRRAEKRKGKRPEQTAQQKADARAARRRARAEADEEAYREAYRPILTIKHSQGFVWNQVCVNSPQTSGCCSTRLTHCLCFSVLFSLVPRSLSAP